MSLIFTQRYVADMCESIDAMKITAKQKEFARAVLRSAIEFANARNGMHASANAKAAALPSTDLEYDPNVAPCDDAEFGMKP